MAGGLPIMLPLTQEKDIIAQLAEQCDGFLLTGGQDVSPELYGEKKCRYAVNVVKKEIKWNNSCFHKFWN